MENNSKNSDSNITFIESQEAFLNNNNNNTIINEVSV